MHKKLIYVGVASLILSGCGLKDKGNNSEFRKTYYVKQIYPLYKQFNSCNELQKSKAESEENNGVSLQYYQFLNGMLQVVNSDYSIFTQKNYVLQNTKNIVSSIKYGGKIEKLYTYYYDEITQDYFLYSEEDAKIGSESKELSFCNTDEIHGRYSYEGVGLSSLNSVYDSYSAINNLGLNINLSPVSVVIGYEKLRMNKYLGGAQDKLQLNYYKADNASYSPLEKELTIYPQSIQSKDDDNAPLWDYRMVGSHEYGHHVFNELVTKYEKKDFDHNDFEHDISCFASQENYQKMMIELFAEDHDNSSTFALRSINEGVADLIAYYTVKEGFNNYKKLECFKSTREVDSFYTWNASKKVFSAEGVELMDSTTRKIHEDPSCDDIDYQEIHSVGSIFAHQLDAFYSKYTKDRQLKLKYLILWQKKLADEQTTLKSLNASYFIFHAMELAMKVSLDEMGSSAEDSKCSLMNDAFEEVHKICRYLK